MCDANDVTGSAIACPHEEAAASYAADKLSGEDRSQFESHLSQCENCRESVRAFGEILGHLNTLPDAECDLTGRIAAALATGERFSERRPLFMRRLAISLAAAAALFLAIGLTLALSGDRPDSANRVASVRSPVESTVVTRALDWLAWAQEEDGSWRAEKWGGQRNFTVGLTALAAIALMGCDEDVAGGAYADNIERATNHLLTQQSSSGRFGPTFQGALYNHGIATVALLERYASDPEDELKPVLDKAVSYLVSNQTNRGGWGYVGSQKGGSANTPIAVWQVHALSLARSLGWGEASEATDRGVEWLRSLVDDRGRAGYSAPLDFPYGSDALTAMAAFYLMSNGADATTINQKAMSDAVRTAAARPIEGLDYYRCYFLSYAVRAAEQVDDTKPAEYLRLTLVDRQLQDGPHTGSWEPNDRWSLTGGRVYATALAALSLEADQRAPRVIAMLKDSR